MTKDLTLGDRIIHLKNCPPCRHEKQREELPIAAIAADQHSDTEFEICIHCDSSVRFTCSKGNCINCCTGFDWEMIPITKETR